MSNTRVHWRMTRVEIPEASWRQFRMLAIKMGTTTPEMLGAVIESYLARRRKDAERSHE
jgi:hypothetical protein